MIYLSRIKENPSLMRKGIPIAIFQAQYLAGSEEAVQENIDRLTKAVKKAKKFDVQLIIFPELYLQGYCMTPDIVQKLAEPLDRKSINHVCRIAEENNMGIIS